MVETNLIGAMTATEVFLEQLRDGGGDIVNVSSVAGRTAPADFAVYAATKWGHERLVGIAAPRATARHNCPQDLSPESEVGCGRADQEAAGHVLGLAVRRLSGITM